MLFSFISGSFLSCILRVRTTTSFPNVTRRATVRRSSVCLYGGLILWHVRTFDDVGRYRAIDTGMTMCMAHTTILQYVLSVCANSTISRMFNFSTFKATKVSLNYPLIESIR